MLTQSQQNDKGLRRLFNAGFVAYTDGIAKFNTWHSEAQAGWDKARQLDDRRKAPEKALPKDIPFDPEGLFLI